MLRMLTAALITYAAPDADHTLSTTIPGWSTATFEVSVNGRQVLRLKGKERVSLDAFLRPGENTVEVRYRTDDGKISLQQPARLTIESGKSVVLRIATHIDNPKGRMRVVLRGN